MVKKYSGSRKQSDSRVSFLQNIIGTFSLYLNDSAALEEDRTPSVVLTLPSHHKMSPTQIGLTSLTSNELNLLEEFLQLAFALTRPIITERDRIAQEAFTRGDDSYGRAYRQPSILVVRPRLRKDEETEKLFNSLIDILQASKHAIVDQNKFKNRRTEMDFWATEDEDDIPFPERDSL